ncbi:MAG: hypothetical protein M0R17_04370 [Candidatus Omnitrophica bacterium]|jgi:hypothetical protein|nr:hypothetical protein [Candidatus Omnitrophota bacterium]
MLKIVKSIKGKINYPDYTLDGIASKPVFTKKGKEVKPPKSYKSKFKLWK